MLQLRLAPVILRARNEAERERDERIFEAAELKLDGLDDPEFDHEVPSQTNDRHAGNPRLAEIHVRKTFKEPKAEKGKSSFDPNTLHKFDKYSAFLNGMPPDDYMKHFKDTLKAGEFPEAEELAAARGVPLEKLQEHDPHAHPNPTILNWKDKPTPYLPHDMHEVLMDHAKLEMNVIPDWHHHPSDVHAESENATHTHPVLVEHVVNSLAMHAVRGISEDERHTMHSLAENFAKGSISAQRTLFVYLHGIMTLLTNRSAAHQRFESHFAREVSAQREKEATLLEQARSEAEIKAHHQMVAQRKKHEELVKKDAKGVLNARIMHHSLMTAMSERAIATDDPRARAVTALFLGSLFSAIGNAIASAFESMANWVYETANSVGEELVKAGKAFVDAVGDVVEAVVDAAGALIDFAMEAVQACIKIAKAALMEMAKIAMTILTWIMDMFGIRIGFNIPTFVCKVEVPLDALLPKGTSAETRDNVKEKCQAFIEIGFKDQPNSNNEIGAAFLPPMTRLRMQFIVTLAAELSCDMSKCGEPAAAYKIATHENCNENATTFNRFGIKSVECEQKRQPPPDPSGTNLQRVNGFNQPADPKKCGFPNSLTFEKKHEVEVFNLYNVAAAIITLSAGFKIEVKGKVRVEVDVPVQIEIHNMFGINLPYPVSRGDMGTPELRVIAEGQAAAGF